MRYSDTVDFHLSNIQRFLEEAQSWEVLEEPETDIAEAVFKRVQISDITNSVEKVQNLYDVQTEELKNLHAEKDYLEKAFNYSQEQEDQLKKTLKEQEEEINEKDLEIENLNSMIGNLHSRLFQHM